MPGRHSAGRRYPPISTGTTALPKRNYGYEKRQKEILKQTKRDEKRQRKLDRANDPTAEESPADEPGPPVAPPEE